MFIFSLLLKGVPRAISKLCSFSGHAKNELVMVHNSRHKINILKFTCFYIVTKPTFTTIKYIIQCI